MSFGLRPVARREFALASALLLGACAVQPTPPTVTPPPTPTPVPVTPPPPANALAAGIALVPPAATIYDEWAQRALTS
ncbi:MAG TPA: hypothetical protein VK192_09040, partial [Sphingomicrobium sp.]|nr:hypothetical protein [Sphingomicrobium sp.]